MTQYGQQPWNWECINTLIERSDARGATSDGRGRMLCGNNSIKNFKPSHVISTIGRFSNGSQAAKWTTKVAARSSPFGSPRTASWSGPRHPRRSLFHSYLVQPNSSCSAKSSRVREKKRSRGALITERLLWFFLLWIFPLANFDDIHFFSSWSNTEKQIVTREITQESEGNPTWRPSGRSWWLWGTAPAVKRVCWSSSARTTSPTSTSPPCLRTMLRTSRSTENRYATIFSPFFLSSLSFFIEKTV